MIEKFVSRLLLTAIIVDVLVILVVIFIPELRTSEVLMGVGPIISCAAIAALVGFSAAAARH